MGGISALVPGGLGTWLASSRISPADMGPMCEKVASTTVSPFQKSTRLWSEVAPVPMSSFGQPFWR